MFVEAHRQAARALGRPRRLRRSATAFAADRDQSERIEPPRWTRRSPVERAAEAVATLTRREL